MQSLYFLLRLFPAFFKIQSDGIPQYMAYPVHESDRLTTQLPLTCTLKSVRYKIKPLESLNSIDMCFILFYTSGRIKYTGAYYVSALQKNATQALADIRLTN